MKRIIPAAAAVLVAAFVAGCDRPVTKETTVVERDKTAAAPNVTITPPPATPAPTTTVESKRTDVTVTPPSSDSPGTASKTETTTSTTK